MVLERRTGPYPHWCFEDPASGDALRIVPERGGLVTGWRCGGREILSLDSNRFADPALSVRGGIPVLFPICGNLPGDQLSLPGGSYPLRQHGFARDLPWSLEPLADGTGVAMELGDGPATRPHFPFPFRLSLEFRLEPAALAITARIHHGGEPGHAAMPFSFGLHPYFAVAGLGAVRIEGLPERCTDHLTMAPAATAEQLVRLGQGVDLFCADSGPVRLVDPAAGLALTLETAAPFDCVVVWTEPPRPMVCLEPWTAPRQALVSGDRRLLLAPGESLDLHCRYRVETLA
jgi:galactose mutarotase-like enzyme